MTAESKHGRLWAVVFILLIAAIVAGGGVLAFRWLHREKPVEVDISTRPAAEMEVYLSGAVVEEGMYDVSDDTTIGDLLRSAGGVTEDGDSSRIKIQVLHAGESPYATPGQEAAESKININTASSEALQTLTGIGPAKAQAIIDYRNANGPFRSVEELTEVKGFGEKTLDKIRDEITVVD